MAPGQGWAGPAVTAGLASAPPGPLLEKHHVVRGASLSVVVRLGASCGSGEDFFELAWDVLAPCAV